jgi:cytochrome c-type biogenesis protein CcmH
LEFLIALITVATVSALLVPLLGRRVEATSRLDADLAIYRDQLAELERERAAGGVSEGDAAAARTEIERRILVAAEKDSPQATAAAPSVNRFLPPALCLLVPLFALGVYLKIGQPGVVSAPFVQARPNAPATNQTPGMNVANAIAQTRARLEKAPDDADLLSLLGELLTQEADGVVTQPALDAFNKALAKTPQDPRIRFYLGLHDAQAGDSRAALTRWLDLEADSPDDAMWLPMLRAEIERVSKAANIDPLSIKPDRKAASAPAPQPSQEQREAMAKLSPAEREQAIRGMVDGLAARLKDQPGDRAGWLRLARARGVLGEADRANEAFDKADKLSPLDPQELGGWAEILIRQIAPGTAPSGQAVAVLERLEKAEPDNGLALFYLGAASFAKGDKPEAARRWKRLLGLLPADAPIRELLEKKIKETE